MQIITPTISRKVWYRCVHAPSGMSVMDRNQQPFDATIVYVWSDRCVNLMVTDHYGNTQFIPSVTLRQPDDDAPSWNYCEWMPFQVGQAKAAGSAK